MADRAKQGTLTKPLKPIAQAKVLLKSLEYSPLLLKYLINYFSNHLHIYFAVLLESFPCILFIVIAVPVDNTVIPESNLAFT
jgi:hypothetical protein